MRRDRPGPEFYPGPRFWNVNPGYRGRGLEISRQATGPGYKKNLPLICLLLDHLLLKISYEQKREFVVFKYIMNFLAPL